MSFPEAEILVALLRGPKKGMTVPELRQATGRVDSTIRNNLAMMAKDNGVFGGVWVTIERKQGEQARRFVLTEKGREVARNRARRK